MPPWSVCCAVSFVVVTHLLSPEPPPDREKNFARQSLLFENGMQGGHYSIEGNHFVSRMILDYLDTAGIHPTSAPIAQPSGGAVQ